MEFFLRIMDNKKSTEAKEQELNNYLSLDYMIGLIITVILIITGLITRNSFFYKLAIIFLIITPSAGLIVCLAYYIVKRKLKSVMITITVLLILAASALIGFLNFG